jgi:hypothetical protein
MKETQAKLNRVRDEMDSYSVATASREWTFARG